MCNLLQRVLGSKTVQTLVVEHNVEQRAVNFQPAVVVDEAHLSEPVHKEVNSSSSGTNHFRQGFLADLWNHVF